MSGKPKPFNFPSQADLERTPLYWYYQIKEHHKDIVAWLQEEKAKEICRGCWGFGNNKCVVSCKARDLLIDLRRKVLEVM